MLAKPARPFGWACVLGLAVLLSSIQLSSDASRRDGEIQDNLFFIFLSSSSA
jgi:hypothetical protein